jgi:hypothetical protein
MKKMRVILIVIGIIIISLLTARFVFAQGVISQFEINSPDLKQKILIASQESKFKTDLVSSIVNGLKTKDIYIKVIDVTSLTGIVPRDWNSIIIINTCEAGKLQKNVIEFFKKYPDDKRMILVTTSGSGIWKPDDISIDSISSASLNDNIPEISDSIRKAIDKSVESD